MNFKNLRRISVVLLFVGLLWMMLPHAFHNLVLEEVHEETIFSHYTHLIQGLALTIAGLAIMNYCDKKQTVTQKIY